MGGVRAHVDRHNQNPHVPTSNPFFTPQRRVMRNAFFFFSSVRADYPFFLMTNPKYSNIPPPSANVSTSTLHTSGRWISGRMKCGWRHVMYSQSPPGFSTRAICCVLAAAFTHLLLNHAFSEWVSVLNSRSLHVQLLSIKRRLPLLFSLPSFLIGTNSLLCLVTCSSLNDRLCFSRRPPAISEAQVIN